MRIGIIAPPWVPVPPRLYGGTELVVDQLARGLTEAGHHVVLFTTGDSTCPVERRWLLEQAEGTRINETAPELRHAAWAYAEATTLDLDVIHDHTVAGPLLAHAAAARIAPVVTTLHNQLDSEMLDIYRRAAERVDLIAISHAQRRPAPDLPVARVIHHGIDAAAFPVGRGDGGYCLFLGRMTPDKGAHRAMEAAHKVGARLLMAAKMRTAVERAYFDEQVRPYLNDDLVYLGEVDHDDKLALLAGAESLLVPISWNEPFGMVMIEALACGTPVLAFAEGAAPEIVEDGRTGFLCHDVADMAEAIGRARHLDRTACRSVVEGYFSASRMVAEHISLYEQLSAR